MKKIIKKLRSIGGETLIETLVTILIIALSSVMIMTASVTAARINKQVREAQVSCTMSRAEPSTGSASIIYDNHMASGESAEITIYTDDGGKTEENVIYRFYDKG